MGLFVPLYGSFRVYLKRAVLVPAHGLRPQPKPGPALKYFAPCCVWTVLFSVLHQTRPKCTPITYRAILLSPAWTNLSLGRPGPSPMLSPLEFTGWASQEITRR
jgi:hypothetical protein